MKIMVKTQGQTLLLNVHDDQTIQDMEYILRTILTWLTFHPDTIDSLFTDEG